MTTFWRRSHAKRCLAACYRHGSREQCLGAQRWAKADTFASRAALHDLAIDLTGGLAANQQLIIDTLFRSCDYTASGETLEVLSSGALALDSLLQDGRVIATEFWQAGSRVYRLAESEGAATPATTGVPPDFEVQPLKPDQEAVARMTCATCGLAWDDAIVTSWTPAPSGRCPFEYFHPG